MKQKMVHMIQDSKFSLFAFLCNISIIYKYFDVWRGDP